MRALLLLLILSLSLSAAPVPFPTHRREKPRIAGTYHLHWGGTRTPGYGLTLHPDGRQTTVAIRQVEGGEGYELCTYSRNVWTGHWRYDRASNRVRVVESHDGGHTVTHYTFDLATGLGRTERGMAVAVRRVR